MLATIAFLHGKKWSSMNIKRVYFGNFLRDYSQALDIGTLKSVNAETIRILVWVLSFMAFGYATEEFEVTSERLGVYRAEEHIDNPLGYGEGVDARTFDPRLRGPVMKAETEIDMRTGMKNYIANETGQWPTSSGYIRFSFARSIHYGRLYTSGAQRHGDEDDLCEALRCLGQALHCLEDFGAHSNYCELALREMGYRNVFPHCGTAAEINVHGKRVYPLVTGTFGAVDFLHSVIGEATDHFTQSEVEEVDIALKNAENNTSGKRGDDGSRGLFGIGGSGSGGGDFISLVSKLPGVGDGFAAQARDLKAQSEAQERENRARADAPAAAHTNPNQIPGMSPDFDPVKTAGRIYPILQFRDKIVKAISRGIAKVPGLESLLEHISETLTAFIMGLLAPFIRPIIKAVSKALKDGSSGVISASARSQLEPWENPHCSDPTHSMLAKDHFTNILNSCGGRVAVTVLQYAVPRILYAWENPGVPVDEVANDILRAFHHPGLRDDNIQLHRDMFATVKKWADEHPKRHQLESILSSESVKKGKNHVLEQSQQGSRSGGHSHSHGAFEGLGGHGKVAGSLWGQVRTRDLDAMEGRDGDPTHNYQSHASAPPGPAFNYGQNAQYQSGGYNAPPPQSGMYNSGYSSGYGHAQPQGPPPPHGHGSAQDYYNAASGQSQSGSNWGQYPGQYQRH
ncbi:unnamed protein product [Clonostachys rosea]|uniref:Het-C-domain-containing protein n=1 Tax=Bionectria ochroleuca TaxID=29856 RepID=A0ABY6TNK5_BIOOC|nr:unnamed protein product [Clonostachys rosea]